jgi:hypothetical protein
MVSEASLLPVVGNQLAASALTKKRGANFQQSTTRTRTWTAASTGGACRGRFSLTGYPQL